MVSREASGIVSQVRGVCRAGGLDLAHAFCLSWLGPEATDIERLVPEAFRSDALGVLIANTRALWPSLREARRRGPSTSEHPVDSHVEGVLAQAIDDVEAPLRTFFSHRRYAGDYLPFQRIAHLVGFTHLAPSNLCIHPTHGPWVALRAIVIVDVAGPPPPAPIAPDPCSGCEQPCVTALDAAVARGRAPHSRAPHGRASHGRVPHSRAVEDDWRAWLAVRDACPEGKSSRYSDAQIAYHYTKRREHLEG